MEPESSNLATASISSPLFTEERKDGMFLPDAERETELSTTVFGDTSVTIDQSIPNNLKQAYSNSFVSLSKPEILNTIPQNQLLEYAEVVKQTSQRMIQEAEENEQVALASQVLAEYQVFLDYMQRQYDLYLAPGATHQEQTEQNTPTISSELENNKIEQEGLKNAFITLKNIAMKALVLQ